MAITISGENNNDRILAADGVIDQISGINFSGIITASHINVGSNIQLGNAGIVTATTFIGNLTGNVNSTSPLLLQTGGSERFRITGNNELGIAGANYGSAGQVLTSGGSGSAVTWSAVPAQITFSNPSNNRILTSEGGIGVNCEANLTWDGNKIHATATGEIARFQSTNSVSTIRLYSTASSHTEIGHTEDTYIAVGGSERLRIKGSNGFVGISTSSPGRMVHIFSRNTGHPLILERGDGSNTQIEIKAAGVTRGFWGSSSTANFMVYDNDTSDINFVVNQTGKVGINETSPLGTLHIKEGDSGLSSANANADTIFIENSANAGITIATPNTNTGYLIFADPEDDNIGQIIYRHGGSDANSMGFFVNASERLRITRNGNVLIGNGNVTTQEGDGRLIVYANTRLHPAIKADCIDGGVNRANGFTMLADNYGADESLTNIGVSYSGGGLVLSRGVKVSNASDDVYLSSVDSFATKPCALKLDTDSNLTFLNTNTSATTTTDSAVTLTRRFKIDSSGQVRAGDECNSDRTGYRHQFSSTAGSGDVLSIQNPSNSDGQGIGLGFWARNTNNAAIEAAKIKAVIDETQANSTQKGSLKFFTNKDASLGERMQINSSGNVRITGSTHSNQGTSAGNVPLQIVGGGNNVVTMFLGNGNTAGNGVNDYSADIRFNGAAVAWGDLSYYPTGNSNGGAFRFTGNGSTVASQGNRSIGCSGIFISGTSQSQHLDDYEEGSWTPSIYPMSSNIPITYSTRVGQYTKIGNVVYWQFQLQVSNITGNRNQGFGINGFPHNINNTHTQCSGEFYGETWDGEIPTTIKYISNTNRGVCYYYADAMKYYSSSMLDINVSSSMLMGSGHYFV